MVRGGTYAELVRINNSGEAGRPITLAAYPGESVVIDGGYDGTPEPYVDLVAINGDHVLLDGIEIANSCGPGLGIHGHDNVARSLVVHHSQQWGVWIDGDRNMVEDCTIWRNVMENENGSKGVWGAGIAAIRYPQHTIIRDNVVYNNWGEGINTCQADHTTIEDNVVYDNFSVQLYIDNSPWAIVQRNLVYDTDDAEFAIRKASAIGMSEEAHQDDPARMEGVWIVNNLAMGGSSPFFFFMSPGQPGGGLRDCLIAHNTFVNTHKCATFRITPSDYHGNTRIENNLILEEGVVPIAEVADDPELQFSNNLWSKAPPSAVRGPGDVIGDPLLAKMGSIEPGELTADWFALTAGSPARGRAKVISEVSEDYFGLLRGDEPDMGACQYR